MEARVAPPVRQRRALEFVLVKEVLLSRLRRPCVDVHHLTGVKHDDQSPQPFNISSSFHLLAFQTLKLLVDVQPSSCPHAVSAAAEGAET